MADTLNLEAEHAAFEAQLPTHWSRERMADNEGDMVYVDDLTAGAFGGWLMARRSTSSVSDTCAEMRALCSACGGTGDVHRPDGEYVGEYVGECDCAATKAAAPADAPKDHEIREAINQLRDVAVQFHATQQLRERIAGIVLPLVKGRAPAEDAREEVQEDAVGRAALMEFAEKYCLNKPELVSCAEAAFYWFNKCARRASSVPAIPGTGGEKEEDK